MPRAKSKPAKPSGVSEPAPEVSLVLTSASAVHVLVFLTVDAGTTWRGFFCSSNVS